MEETRQLTVDVAGEGITGKSTVLVLIAQYLNTLGYNVSVPKHLVGLSVNTGLLRLDTSAETTIQLTETNTEHGTNYADWAADFVCSRPDADYLVKERDRLEELSSDCYKRIQALADEVAKRCTFSLGDIVEVNPKNSPRYWFVIQRIGAHGHSLEWTVGGRRTTKSGRINGGYQQVSEKDFKSGKAVRLIDKK